MPSLVGGPNIDPMGAAAKIESGPAADAAQSVPAVAKENTMETEESGPMTVATQEVKDSDTKKDPASESTDSNDNAAATPKSKKRKVTPAEDSESKQTQQEKVKQMSLSSFFMPSSKNGKSPMATGSAKPKNSNASKKKRSKAGSSVLENLPSPRKRPLEETLEEKNSNDDGDEKIADTTMNGEKVSNLEAAEGDSKAEQEDVDTKPATKEDGESKQAASSSNDETKSAEESKPEADVVDLSMDDAINEPNPQDGKDDKAPAAAEAKPPSKPKATRKRAPKKKPEPKKEPPARLEEKDLPADRLALHEKYKTMKVRYLERSSQLVSHARGGIEEEDYKKQALEPLEENESLDSEDFPTRVVGNMALIVEGSNLPLSSLVETVCTQLQEVHGKEWSADSVSAKIKILAQRKAYFDAATKSSGTTVDLFEDADEDRVWRWEISTLDLLPSETLSKARKARTARKKVASYHAAVGKLLKSLDDADAKIFDPKLPKLEAVTAKISRDEEKVLKFEREAEKQRLADEAKAIKLQAKKKAKEEAAEKKKREKEEAAEKKRREKEDAAQAKEEAKRKKEEEKEQEELAKKAKEQKKEKSLAKQKNCLMSFFNAPKKAKTTVSAKPVTAAATASKVDFDSETFRSAINSSSKPSLLSFHQNLSTTAKSSRKRRTKRVPVLIYTTVESQQDDGWDAPAYAEEKTIMVPNRYRFLSFHEDCRPPYHGTWSKKSSIVTGKTPFGKESKVFDYEYDSEAEWEEGDDEVGEDVDDDEKNQEEDADEKLALYDYDDGFCVSDDKMLDDEENADEETRALYKKKVQQGETEKQISTNRIQIIAPAFGGVPLDMSKMTDDRFEGYERLEVRAVLQELQGNTLCDVRLCVDAFPQTHLDEEKQQARSSSPTNVNADKDEYTKEAMVAMARAVHHNTLNSKDKVVEDLRSSHPTLFLNRAKATRKLDAIATKKKHPNVTGGYYWEVNDEVLKEHGLTDLIGKVMPGIEAVDESKSAAKGKKPAAAKGKKPAAKATAKKPAAKKTSAKSSKSTPKSKQASGSAKKRKSPATDEGDKAGSPKAADESDKGSASKVKPSKKAKGSPEVSTASKNLMMNFLNKT